MVERLAYTEKDFHRFEPCTAHTMQDNNSLLSRIEIDPQKRGGKPCIKGTRITVSDVMSYLATGMTINEILYDFPHIQKEDILACFAFCVEMLYNQS